MRLPQQLTESLLFMLQSEDELIDALGANCTEQEALEIKRLVGIGLPPVTSTSALSVMMGYNPGFIWSLMHRTRRHYRAFKIPKGDGVREIYGPKVGLKALQKWLSLHFQRAWVPSDNVHGFVPGRSHITAAQCHLGAEWVFSVDIENFFPSVLSDVVSASIRQLGYASDASVNCLTKICCLGHSLVQGAPTSPVISNVALHQLDSQLAYIADSTGTTFTRYADDIVFSGKGDCPDNLTAAIEAIFVESGWKLAPKKSKLATSPERLKVHGLLVHGENIRLTKGYRNRIRAYSHLVQAGKIDISKQRNVAGHLNYARQIDRFAKMHQTNLEQKKIDIQDPDF